MCANNCPNGWRRENLPPRNALTAVTLFICLLLLLLILFVYFLSKIIYILEIIYFNQRRFNEISFGLMNCFVFGRRLVHAIKPENGPNDADHAEKVEYGLPVKHFADDAAKAERKHGAQIGARQGKRGQTASLERRRPVRPQAMHRRKNEALSETLKDARDNQTRRTQISGQRNEQSEKRAEADAGAKESFATIFCG